MSYTPAERRRVFLAYRTAFNGTNTRIRKTEKVREVVQSHSKSFEPLVRSVDFEKVVDVVKSLLDHSIFVSELQAKIAFPELFRSPPARDAQRSASEVDAARSEAEALEVLSPASEQGGAGMGDTVDNVPQSNYINSPIFVSLLHATQHLILTTAQRQLDECCFDFAAKWLPSLLKVKKWECPEAAELIKWTRTLAKHSGKVPAGAIWKVSEAPLSKVFSSTDALRHTAVHRLVTSERGIEKMIQSASRLANALGDSPRAAELEKLCLEMGSRIRDMELNKNFLENRLDEQLQAINKKHGELDREEKEAIATMLSEDRVSKSLAGAFLEDAVKNIFGRPESEPTSMMNGLRESGEIDEGNEHENDQEPELSNGDIDARIPADL
ncbi:hypothetical protein BGZ57DRAFT_806396 [Hyaloscypha finlandica]|nr:hypothetical protein BGZ57DRAFT_806396 [Hyaloscypha finlandica]